MHTQQNNGKQSVARKRKPKKPDRMSPEYQHAVVAMVGREVYYCASMLVSELAKNPDYMDELMDVLQGKPDYEEAARQEGWEIQRARMTGNVTFKKQGDKTAHMFEGWQDLCESEGIEPYQWEIYEHWIVSDWLADRLEKRGHVVLRDFLGLTIWGRPTTGQAISMDSVIQSIYDDMMKPVQ